MKILSSIFLALVLASGAFAADGHFAKYLDDGDGNRVLVNESTLNVSEALAHGTTESRYPQSIAEHEEVGRGEVVEIIGERAKVLELLNVREVKRLPFDETWDDAIDEVQTIIDNGPVENRIDSVFMGDGYTEKEKAKFLEDVKRLTKEMFEGPTYHSYLPLFNVHAVFRASKESGIGKNDKPKDTAYGLYREGNTLRAIFASKPYAAHASCQKAPACDFPILVGNDPYYGGLGGQFTITTSSPTSGTVVLRHELGHNFGKVGEEYDGAVTYYGANHARSLSSVSWKHWVDGSLKAEKSTAHYIDWPWHEMVKGPFKVDFKSDGNWNDWEVVFGASGAQTDDDMRVTLDGNRVPFKSPGHADRVYHRFGSDKGFSKGEHQIEFQEGVKDGDNMLTSLIIHEYSREYPKDRTHVSAYPLFSQQLKENGYRPTHDGCLMRNMASDRFCTVCQENNWIQFFSKMTMIDDVRVEKKSGRVFVSLQIPKLGQFREGGALSGEKVEIRWTKNGADVPDLVGKTTWDFSEADAKGKWEVNVALVTTEVRKDAKGVLTAKKQVKI